MAPAYCSTQVDFSDPVELRNLGRAVSALFQKWELSAEQQLALLGSGAHEGEDVSEPQDGELRLTGSARVLQRVALLMGIHSSLRLLFPENEDLRFSWVRRCNQAFGGSAPIDIMLRDGVEGMKRVWALLDQQW